VSALTGQLYPGVRLCQLMGGMFVLIFFGMVSLIHGQDNQGAIPPEVREALYPRVRPQVSNHDLPQHANALAESRGQFNDSLFSEEQNESAFPLRFSHQTPPDRQIQQASFLDTKSEGSIESGSQTELPAAATIPKIRPQPVDHELSIPRLATVEMDRSRALQPNYDDRPAEIIGGSNADVGLGGYSDGKIDGWNPQQPRYSGATLEELLLESNLSSNKKRGTPSKSQGTQWNQSQLDSSDWDNDPSSDATAAPIEFAEQIQRIAVSLCIVLFLGVSFVFGYQRWVKATGKLIEKPRASHQGPQNQEKIQVICQLPLDAKSHVFLIEASNQKVLIVSDVSGIKSVVPLPRPFEETWQGLAETEHLTSSGEQDFDESDSLESETAGMYTPAARRFVNRQSNQSTSRQPQQNRNGGGQPSSANSAVRERENGTVGASPAEIESEMRKKLADLLGGEAFRDVFLKQADQSRSVKR